MHILLVGGTFDSSGGKPSSIINDMHAVIEKGRHYCKFCNGGTFDGLAELSNNCTSYDVILWFPNIDNSYPKIGTPKQTNPFATLVTSKRNVDGKYSFADLVNRALGSKSNFMLEFTRPESMGGRYFGRLFDSLGCVWKDHTPDFHELTEALLKRVAFIRSLHRMGSIKAGKKIPVPIETNFFKLVKGLGNRFHDLIHPAEGVKRFLGNASFRCARGFPAFRANDSIFVSARDVDKRHIGRESFVEVAHLAGKVIYTGNEKPSVDAPIMLSLFRNFPNINYMIHSHTYIVGARFTSAALPCGTLEEVQHILAVACHNVYFPMFAHFNVNLLGHGSIAMAANPSLLGGVEYYARPTPERIAW